MYERRGDKLLPPREFAIRVLQHGGVVALVVGPALIIGVIGYHTLVGLPWIDALLNASMILGGMGPVGELRSDGAKIFAALYALFAGLFFIAMLGLVLAPFLHRLAHRLHIEDDESS